MGLAERELGEGAEARGAIIGSGGPSTRATEAREALVARFHLDSAFVSVQKLSRVLGIAPSTIYGYIRQGIFFLPYRMLNTSPVVSLDDLVEWYCAADDFRPAAPAPEPPNPRPAPAIVARGAPDPRAAVDDFVRAKLLALGLDPNIRKRRQPR